MGLQVINATAKPSRMVEAVMPFMRTVAGWYERLHPVPHDVPVRLDHRWCRGDEEHPDIEGLFCIDPLRITVYGLHEYTQVLQSTVARDWLGEPAAILVRKAGCLMHELAHYEQWVESGAAGPVPQEGRDLEAEADDRAAALMFQILLDPGAPGWFGAPRETLFVHQGAAMIHLAQVRESYDQRRRPVYVLQKEPRPA